MLKIEFSAFCAENAPKNPENAFLGISVAQNQFLRTLLENELLKFVL